MAREQSAGPNLDFDLAFRHPASAASLNNIQRLHDFHAAHFPGSAFQQQGHPISPARAASHGGVELEPKADDGLGNYPDGVKRTLTDMQIKIFRHSEIQRLMQQRRQQREKDEEEDARRRRHRKPGSSQPTKLDDEAVQQNHHADTLVYDEDVSSARSFKATEKKFSWPRLGG